MEELKSLYFELFLSKLFNNKPRKGKGERNFHREDYKRVVLFTTSLGCIRKSFDDSKALKAILDNQFIVYEERDLYLSEDYRLELKERFQLIQSKCWAGRISNVTKNDQFRIPALFVSGFLLGNFEEVEKLNEIGKLARILEQYQFTYIKGCLPSSSSTSPSSSNHFEEDKVSNNAVSSSTDIGSKDDDDDDSLRSSPIIDRTSESSPISFVRRCSPISNLKMSRSVMPCVRCGERRFVNCDKCNGSRKTVVHHFHCGTLDHFNRSIQTGQTNIYDVGTNRPNLFHFISIRFDSIYICNGKYFLLYCEMKFLYGKAKFLSSNVSGNTKKQFSQRFTTRIMNIFSAVVVVAVVYFPHNEEYKTETIHANNRAIDHLLEMYSSMKP
ncbi:Glutaredoxin domain-containing cysteine-rich protein 1 [Blomia tropicalis]|nr:Glutaredoxin domain-containing cysteine-rich protein 1 [Blomia tropicalis]